MAAPFAARLAGPAASLVASIKATADAAGAIIFPATAAPPSAPLAARALAGDGFAVVSWLKPAYGTPIDYVVTASPGGATAIVTGRKATVTGLTNGTDYTFTVVARWAGGNSPPSLPTLSVRPTAQPSALSLIPGLAARWSASSLAMADGAAISSWADISGNGRSASQATSINRPTFLANWRNGQPAVNFNGAAQSQFLTTDLSAKSSKAAIFIAFELSAAANSSGSRDQRLFSSQTRTSADVGLNIDTFASSGNAIRTLNSNGAAVSSSAISTATPYIMSLTTEGGALYVNGAKQATSPINGLTLNNALFQIGNHLNGSGKHFAGRIAEILFYEELTTAQRQAVEGFLSTTYSISVVQS